MTNVLITGAYGQLGSELKKIAPKYAQHTYFFTDVDTLDICNKQAILKFCIDNSINYILNCAAYTAVDKAEEEEQQSLCYAINAEAVKHLGEVASQIGASIIHISTDYVFDGKSYIPYTEDVTTNPHSLYGKSKLLGEQWLMKSCSHAIIIRTSWLYSTFGNNFVKTMIKLGTERTQLNVIFDQIGTPTYAADLAEVMLEIISKIDNQDNANTSGIYHFSNEGVCSWYDFTIAIHALFGITTCNVLPIESKEYPTKAPRPHYSVLNKHKIKATFGITIPHWQTSLTHCIAILKEQN
jgi:dTDP-4-dehydrorhamnose reductase